VLQTAPNDLARSPGDHSDRYGDGGRRGQAGQHADQDGQEGEHDGDRYPQGTVHERAPRRLVDTEYPGVEQRHENRPHDRGERQGGQHFARDRGGHAVRVSQLPEQEQRNPQAE
jgi:hypothetical protein